MLGNHPQIVGENAPADPALHPIIAVVPAAIQPMPPFEPADASFNAGAPVPTTTEPALPLVRQSGRRFAPWSWQDNPCDTTLLGCPFIRGCRQFAIPSNQSWRVAKLLAVSIQAWHELGRIIGIAVQDARLGNDATLSLPQPQHPAELGR